MCHIREMELVWSRLIWKVVYIYVPVYSTSSLIRMWKSTIAGGNTLFSVRKYFFRYLVTFKWAEKWSRLVDILNILFKARQHDSKSCTVWQHGIVCTSCAPLLQVGDYYWIVNSDSYCFLKQSPTGKKSQHLSWYSFQTYVSWPVNSVSSLLIKCIRKNLNFESVNKYDKFF